MTDPAQEQDGRNLLERLRRRKVVQWGIAYAAGAWGFQQGVAYVSSLLDWPTQLQRLSGLVLLVGLAIVVVLAWYHGDRGEQTVSRREVAILTLLFLLGGGLFWRLQHSEHSAPAVEQASQGDAGIATDRSIAVLPFVNASPDKDQDYFAEGISEDLLGLLAKVPGLRVIARSSSFAFKGQAVDVAEVAQRLHVATVLEGSVRKSGDTLRVTAELVRASDRAQVWSQSYDRRMTDVFKVQDEIAAAVVAELRIKLLGPPPTSRAVDPEAYASYLQARALGRQTSEVGLRDSIALLQQVLKTEPDYVAAWQALASDYLNEGNQHLRPMDEAVRLGRDAINRALALDPDFAPAYATLAYASMTYDADLAGAARSLQHAMALAPSDPVVVNASALLANALGRREAALALIGYVIATDPVNPVAQQNGGLIELCARRPDRALERFRTAARLAPTGIGNHFAIAMLLQARGDPTAAMEELREEASERMRLVGVGIVAHQLGHDEEADAALAEAIRKFGADAAFQLAFAYALRRDADRAFEWLAKAAAAHDSRLFRVAVEPWLDSLHADPRWLPFLRGINLAPDQLAAIKFDVKVPG